MWGVRGCGGQEGKEGGQSPAELPAALCLCHPGVTGHSDSPQIWGPGVCYGVCSGGCRGPVSAASLG